MEYAFVVCLVVVSTAAACRPPLGRRPHGVHRCGRFDAACPERSRRACPGRSRRARPERSRRGPAVCVATRGRHRHGPRHDRRRAGPQHTRRDRAPASRFADRASDDFRRQGSFVFAAVVARRVHPPRDPRGFADQRKPITVTAGAHASHCHYAGGRRSDQESVCRAAVVGRRRRRSVIGGVGAGFPTCRRRHCVAKRSRDEGARGRQAPTWRRTCSTRRPTIASTTTAGSAWPTSHCRPSRWTSIPRRMRTPGASSIKASARRRTRSASKSCSTTSRTTIRSRPPTRRSRSRRSSATRRGTPRHKLVHIGLQGRRIADESLPPRNLVFLIDVSGSMMSPLKLPLVKQVALDAGRPSAPNAIAWRSSCMPARRASCCRRPAASDRTSILAAIDALEAGGSTNGGAGIQLAYQVAAEHFIQQRRQPRDPRHRRRLQRGRHQPGRSAAAHRAAADDRHLPHRARIRHGQREGFDAREACRSRQRPLRLHRFSCRKRRRCS